MTRMMINETIIITKPRKVRTGKSDDEGGDNSNKENDIKKDKQERGTGTGTVLVALSSSRHQFTSTDDITH